MKQIFTLLVGIFLFFTTKLTAQSFTVQHDTVNSAPPVGVSTTIEDGVTATVSSATIDWKVIASDFPTDWVPVYSICDNASCWSGSGLWTPSGGTLATKTSMPYGTTLGDFHMVVDFTSSTSTGCHYMTVRMNNHSSATDTAYETYVICNYPLSAPIFNKSSDDIILYPNPAHDELNVVYDASSDIKNIAVYNIIGKVLTVYKVTNNNSANLNIENIPSGIYFVRLINSHGDVVVTRKFTKQ